MKWETMKLSDCCNSIADGDHQPPPKANQGVPFVNTCFILTVKLICNDCETLKSFALSIKEPVYSMFILQY